MKLSTGEVVALGVLGLYIAFGTHPAPTIVSDFLSNPLGLLLGLGVVGYVGVKVSFVVALFAAIALLMSNQPTFEYFEPKKDVKKDEQPTSSGVPKPEISGALGRLLQTAGKSVTKPPPATTVTKPAPTHKEYAHVE